MRTVIMQTHSNEYQKLHALTVANHVQYAGHHGYDMLLLHHPYTLPELGDFYLKTIRLLLQTNDTVITVGADVIFTDMAKPISFFTDPACGAVMSLEDIGGSPVNNDLMIWQRGELCERVLDRMTELWKETRHHPWLLQQALNIMRHEPGCGVKYLPCRQLQSYPVRTYPQSAWQPGDFALHFLAMSIEDKYARCRHFLQTGQVMWRD